MHIPTYLSTRISIRIAAGQQQLKPQSTIRIPGVLVLGLVLSLIIAIALIVLVVLLSRPRKAQAPKPRGAHTGSSERGVWRARIQKIVDDHAQGSITRDIALNKLAEVARDFASEQTGRDLSSHTLSDIGSVPGTTADAHGIALLRQTINALYPPEFADATINPAAQETSVEEAGEWVSNLVERWRR
ncbi:hypothetical protein [Bifidobacterium sp. ESL0790]|uniref:hypothetical protein n=1 Tax=Bifidobacterium sp. ESL0790 TaxID=2983233 RepID=UPI0023FA4A5C|nr:hypothetical protein [Bifidobacterium sp. ESL0790]WEV71867.1 hypothetical protein OZY47_05265 [Bifidobacterium sp. ESL0790]